MDRGAHLVQQNELGRIAISSEAIAQIVGNVVAQSYGVVGRVGRRGPLRVFARDRDKRGVTVRRRDDGLALDVHVVVESGLNLAEVASNVRSRIDHEVRRLTGLDVAAVDVHIERVRRSS